MCPKLVILRYSEWQPLQEMPPRPWVREPFPIEFLGRDGLGKKDPPAVKTIGEPVKVFIAAERFSTSHTDRADDAIPLPVL